MSSFDPERRRAAKAPERSLGRRRWVPFFLVLALVAGAIIAANLQLARAGFGWIERHPGSDKAGHFILLGSLAFALNLALRGRLARCGPVGVQLGGLLVGAAITIEEFSQLWIPARLFDWGDLAANYAGILCADWLARRCLR